MIVSDRLAETLICQIEFSAVIKIVSEVAIGSWDSKCPHSLRECKCSNENCQLSTIGPRYDRVCETLTLLAHKNHFDQKSEKTATCVTPYSGSIGTWWHSTLGIGLLMWRHLSFHPPSFPKGDKIARYASSKFNYRQTLIVRIRMSLRKFQDECESQLTERQIFIDRRRISTEWNAHNKNSDMTKKHS